MTAPRHLRLTLAALAPDGRSVLLHALDGATSVRIFLDWSDNAQGHNCTGLNIDGRSVKQRSSEEAEWIAAIAGADHGGDTFIAYFRDNLLEKLRSPMHQEPSV